MHCGAGVQVKTTQGDGKSQAEVTTEKYGLEAGLYQVRSLSRTGRNSRSSSSNSNSRFSTSGFISSSSKCARN